MKACSFLRSEIVSGFNSLAAASRAVIALRGAWRRLGMLAWMAAALGGARPAEATLLSTPVVGIRAAVVETREPACDPAMCDAATPAPAVLVVTRRGGDLTQELGVSLAWGGTASNGVDYAELRSAVVFPAGASAVEVRVAARFDRLVEGDEVVVGQILPDPSMGPVARYVVDSVAGAARVVIHDSSVVEPSVVRIEAVSPIAEETSAPLRRMALRGVFRISRSGSVANPQPVFVLYGGTATRGVDYGELPMLVTIPAGTNAVELVVEPKVDDIAEPIEILEARLSECPPLTDPPMLMPCYLVDIDPRKAAARVFLRDDGITTASLQITSPRSGATVPAGVTVPVRATAIDLDGAITEVEFLDGEKPIGASRIFFLVAPEPGTPIEHSLAWTDAAEGPHRLQAVAANAAGVKVVSPAVEFTVGGGLPVVSIAATVPETAEPGPTIRVIPGAFTLRRSGDVAKALRVFMLYEGTALAGVDYQALPSVVEFPAGAATVELKVAALADLLVEGDEVVVARLAPSILAIPPEYQISTAAGAARVIIHDTPVTPPPPLVPLVTIAAVDGFAREGLSSAGVADPAVFVVRRSGPTNDALKVSLRVGGTAENGVDYRELPKVVEVPAGVRAVRLVVQPVEDRIAEGIETVLVGVLPSESDPASYLVGEPARAAAVIVDAGAVRPACLRLPDGMFNLCVPVDVDRCFQVEMTRDFITWTVVGEVPMIDGVVHWVDPDAAGRVRAFYRVVPVPCAE